jgi:hypothetical protein
MEEGMNRDQALSKIKKCLALSKSSNPHEAAAGMRQAQKLMAEHGLSDTDVTLADVCEHGAKLRMKTITPWENMLAKKVAEAFGCDFIIKYTARQIGFLTLSVKRERIFNFIGVGAAPQVAAYAYEVLGRQCAKARSEHIAKQPKSCKPITKTARGDEFAFGWVVAVQALLDQVAGNEANALLIEQFMGTRYPDLTTTATKDRTKGRNISTNDLHQGIQAGKSAQLNRGVGGVQQRELLA